VVEFAGNLKNGIGGSGGLAQTVIFREEIRLERKMPKKGKARKRETSTNRASA
jgi:hypothetical protein